MRRVIVHGFTPEPVEVQTAADTALEIIESIGRQLPCLQADLFLGPKQVEVVGYRSVEDLAGPLKDDVINIVPSFIGAKSALGQILLGGLLIALSFVPGLQFFSGFLFKVGALLILGGLAQLLAPAPMNDSTSAKAMYLGAPKNTVQIGTRVAILVGRRKWGGHLISFDINAVQVRPYGGPEE